MLHLWASSLKFIIFILCVLLNVAFFTLLERKILGYIQIRKGPGKAGLLGLLQPFSDAIKLFTKEVNLPHASNQYLFTLGPVVSLSIMLCLWMTVPMEWSSFEIELSSVFLLCCMSLGVYPIFVSGWASNSKYPLLGSLRAIAQTISYEVSLALILLSFLVMVGSLSLADFNTPGGQSLILVAPVLGVMWGLTCLVETGRSPFDLPESESELVSGFNTEYSSGPFALFFLGEYGSMLFLSFTTSILLVSSAGMILPLCTLVLVIMFIWARGTLPRYRYDVLMALTWKVFLPSSLAYFIFVLALTLYF